MSIIMILILSLVGCGVLHLIHLIHSITNSIKLKNLKKKAIKNKNSINQIYNEVIVWEKYPNEYLISSTKNTNDRFTIPKELFELLYE